MHPIPSAEIHQHTEEMELNVISLVFLEPKKIYEIEELFLPEYFYFQQHKKIVTRLVERFREDIETIDLELMAYEIQDAGLSFSNLVDRIPSAELIKHYAEKVKALYLWREARNVAASILAKGELFDPLDLQNALSEVQDGLVRIEGQTLPPKSKLIPQDEAVASLLEYLDDTTPDQFLLTGLLDLDNLIGGFKPSQLIILGGRPSMGKTAITMTFLESFSKQGKRTLFFSEEMKIRDMMKRMASHQANIDLQLIDRKKKTGESALSPEQKSQVREAMKRVADYPISWHDDSITTGEMKNLAKHLQREEGLDCIIIDHLGEISPDNPRLSDYEKTSQIVKDIRNLSKELDVPVVLLSQLSRATEARNDKRPNLGDLRESGKIEELADIVIFLYRDDYYNEDSEKKNIMELIVAKHRNGACGSVEALFLRSYAKVLNLENHGFREALDEPGLSSQVFLEEGEL